MTDPLILQVARLIWEAESPLAIGAGAPDDLFDTTLARDANDLPILPATSLIGVLRAALYDPRADLYDEDEEFRLFGDRPGKRGDEGSAPGALSFSDALSLSGAGEVLEKLADPAELTKDSLRRLLLQAQPIQRDHVRLGAEGAVDGSGKFTRAAVPRGARFLGAVECWNETELWEAWLKRLAEGLALRFGGATRSGYGAARLIGLETRSFDLRDPAQRAAARESLRLSKPLSGEIRALSKAAPAIEWSFRLAPEEPFRFGQGAASGEDPADLRPLRETEILWTKGGAEIRENGVFIPASAVKGALRHRTAFHHRRLNGLFDEAPRKEDGLEALFGSADAAGGGLAGALIFEDMRGFRVKTRRIARTSIDRFTGGVQRRALFTEDVDEAVESFVLRIRLARPSSFRSTDHERAFEKALAAFEEALSDLKRGWLALGASGSKGLGVFRETTDPKEAEHA